jgi:putative DNA primase/helicase
MSEDRTPENPPQVADSRNQKSVEFVELLVLETDFHKIFIAGSVPGSGTLKGGMRYTETRLRNFPDNERHHLSAGLYPKSVPDPTVAVVQDKKKKGRADKDAEAFFAIVFDDVGRKIVAPEGTTPISKGIEIDVSAFDGVAEPSWVMETTRGNFQYGFHFDPPLPPDKAGSLHGQLDKTIFGPGLHSLGQFFRLPSGHNTKPQRGNFATQLVSVGPSYTFRSFCTAFGLDPAWREPPKTRTPEVSGVHGETCTEEVLAIYLEGVPNDEQFNEGLFHDRTSAYDEFVKVIAAIRNGSAGAQWGYDLAETWMSAAPQEAGKLDMMWDSGLETPLGWLINEFDKRRQPQDRLDQLAAARQKLAPQAFDVVDDPTIPTRPDGDMQGQASAHQLVVARWIETTCGHRLRFNSTTGRWHAFDGTRWKPHDHKMAFELAKDWAVANASVIPGKADAKAVQKASFADGVENYCRNTKALLVTSGDFDGDPMLLGTPGGVVDLRTGALRPATAADMVSKSTVVAPAEREDCPRWLRFIDEVTSGDLETQVFLRQWAGYCLTGSTKQQCFLFIWGPGQNGKSVFVDTLAWLMGDYFVKPVADMFIKSGGRRHLQEQAMLAGARMISVAEVPAGAAWNESLLKDVTGGGTLTANFMHRNGFTFYPEFKLIAYGNHQPNFPGGIDVAVRRRFRMLEFSFVPKVADLDLGLRLHGEGAGILRWALNGLTGPKGWNTTGLMWPKAMETVTDAYVKEHDPLGRWIMESVEKSVGRKTKTADLFGHWAAWKAAEGLAGTDDILTASHIFSRELGRRLGHKAEAGASGGFFRDIYLKTKAKTPFDEHEA